MTEKQMVDLGTVQETLLIPLWSRAVEAEQPEPILRDGKAVEMLDAIDYDFEKFAKGKASQIGCCLRASTIDTWVCDFLRVHPRGTVVEIGAGLDTRFERTDNGQAHWFELDLPDAIAVRRRFFEETQRRRFLDQSVFEQPWIDVVKDVGQEPVMFVAEGVLMYFEEGQVQELFATLADHFPGASFAFDAMSPLMVKMQKRHDTLSEMSATFRWGISEIKEIEGWGSRCDIRESVGFYDVAKQHIGRFPLMMRVMWSLWPATRRSYAMHLAELGTSSGDTC